MDLYKIEMMKIRMSTYLWALAGITVSLAAMGVSFLFLGVSAPQEEMPFTDWNGLYALSTALSVGFFGIFSAVFASKIIVGEYCGKRVVLLFSYPVLRKKIFSVKSRIVFGVTAVFAFTGNVSVITVMYFTAKIFGISPKGAAGYFIVSVLVSSILAGVLSLEIGMISAAVGWKKRSAVAALISALIIMCFVPNLIAGFPKYIAAEMAVICLLFGAAALVAYRMMADGIERMEV